MPKHQVAKINRILQEHHLLLQLARILGKAQLLRENNSSKSQLFLVQTISSRCRIQNIKHIKFMSHGTLVVISMNKQLHTSVLIHITTTTPVLIMQLLNLYIRCSPTMLTTIKYPRISILQVVPSQLTKDPIKLDAKRVWKIPK